MRRTIIGLVAAVVVAGPVSATAPPAPPAGGRGAQPPAARKAPEGPQPVITIAEKVKDFGIVAKGEKVRATFEVKNTGQAPLEISQVRPTCGCTVADFDHTIPAGGTGKIVAEVDTTGFNGAISKAVLVFSNDPAAPQINLVIKAEVKAFVEVLPRPLVIFQSVLQGEAATQKLTLVSTDGSEFKILSATPSGGPYEISYHELPAEERMADRKGSQWGLTVTVPANAPDGMLNHKILVKTTAPKAPEVTINVTGAVRPVVQVIPSEVNFGTVAGDALVGRNVMINNNRQGTELKLSDLAIDNPNFTTELLPLQAGQKFQVTVTLKAGAPKGTQKATLRIKTSDPARKLLEVPVQAIVQ